MTAFNPGDQVRVSANSPIHVDLTGTVLRPETRATLPGYWITPGPGCVNAWVPVMFLAPNLASGTRVQVDPNSPHYAGLTGYIEEPAVRDDMFGYWLRLDCLAGLAWVPAEALTVLEGGEQR